MSLMSMLTDRCTIKRQVPVETGYDDNGLPVTEMTLGTMATNVPCYMVRKTHDLVQSSSYQTLRENWKVTFPIHTDVQVNDILVIDDMELVAGTPRNVKDHHLSVFATQDIAL